MEALVERGHTVYAVCPDGGYSVQFGDYGVKHISYTIERESVNPFKEKRSIENIYRAISPLKLDIIHTFTAKPNIYGTFAAKRAQVPVILNLVEGLGSFYVDETPKSKLMRFVIERLYKSAFKISDRVVFVNSDDPQYMLDRGILTKDKVEIIKSVGIDTKRFAPDAIMDKNEIKRALGLEGKTVVLMVARAIWHKGIREFYEAAEMLAAEDVAFVLVGDVDRGNPSSANVAFLKQNHVKWLGHRDDIVDLTAIADIYVLPSYREGVPRTLLEAASMGKPIVTTDTMGCREVVDDGINGFLVPVKNSQALASKIARLLADRSLREKMGAESRKKALREFEIEKIVDRYLELYGAYADV